MFSESKLIVKARVIQGGWFSAKFRIIEVLHGDTEYKTIWVTNFSNKYGPYDLKTEGKVYCLFLNKHDHGQYSITTPYKSQHEFQHQDAYDRARSASSFVLSKPNGYSTWTPTAGAYPIKEGKMCYSLLYSDESEFVQWYSFSEFKRLFSAFHQPKERLAYLAVIRSKIAIQDNYNNLQTGEYLKMLYLLEDKQWYPWMEKVASSENDWVRWALCIQFKEVNHPRVGQLLSKFVADPHKPVKRLAIELLTEKYPEKAAPLLLAALPPPPTSDSLMLVDTDGLYTTIKSLKALKYSKAIPKIKPLLTTNDLSDFWLISKTLLELGMPPVELIPYLKWHLESKQSKIAHFVVGDLMVAHHLYQLKEPFKLYISLLDKTEFHTYEDMVSTDEGIAHFNDPETIAFLKDEFAMLSFLPKSRHTPNPITSWFEEFINTFIELGVDDVHEDVLEHIKVHHDYHTEGLHCRATSAMLRYFEAFPRKEDLTYLEGLKVFNLKPKNREKLAKVIVEMRKKMAMND